jgi:hypothetical protein
MRLVHQRPAVAAVPSLVDAVQAVKVLLVVEVAAVALPLVEGAAVVLLVVVPVAGMEAVRWPRVLKCRAWRSSTCCWLPALIRIRN